MAGQLARGVLAVGALAMLFFGGMGLGRALDGEESSEQERRKPRVVGLATVPSPPFTYQAPPAPEPVLPPPAAVDTGGYEEDESSAGTVPVDSDAIEAGAGAGSAESGDGAQAGTGAQPVVGRKEGGEQ